MGRNVHLHKDRLRSSLHVEPCKLALSMIFVMVFLVTDDKLMILNTSGDFVP